MMPPVQPPQNIYISPKTPKNIKRAFGIALGIIIIIAIATFFIVIRITAINSHVVSTKSSGVIENNNTNEATNTTREQAVSRMLSSLAAYASDHNGTLPTSDTIDAFNASVAHDMTSAIDGTSYTYKLLYKSSFNENEQSSDGVTIDYYPGFMCDGQIAKKGSTNRQAALIIALNNNTYNCQDY
jgi:hypothetical protein